MREALSLFRKRGYEATTVADIADAAEIAPRTFFAYFETKESVVFHDLEEATESLRARLEDRQPGETTFEAFRAWLEEWLARGDQLTPAARARRKLIRTTPALRAREELNRGRFQELLAESVGRDLGLPAHSLQPRLVGAAATAALTAVEDEEHLDAADHDRALAVVDDALVFLEAGLRALRRSMRPGA